MVVELSLYCVERFVVMERCYCLVGWLGTVVSCTQARDARHHQDTHISSTPQLNNAMSLEATLEDADAANAAGELVYQEIADKYGIDFSTLSRHYRGVTRTMQEKAIAQQLLTPPRGAGA
jgi:hypothetical protein